MTFAAVAFAAAAFRFGRQPVIFDSYAYVTYGRQIASHGLFHFASPVRSYGYPLFVAACSRLADGVGGLVGMNSDRLLRGAVFGAQLAIFLAASAMAARRLASCYPRPGSRLALYGFGALNPFLLIAATEVLTDLLSAVLVFLAAVLSVPRTDLRRAGPLDPILSMAAAGAATAVRPANAVILLACALVWTARAVRRRDVSAPLLAAAMLAGLLPLVPQMINNSRAFRTATPLVVERLYAKQLDWGAVALKYATAVLPGRAPEVVYRNPLRPPDVFSARGFIERRPAAYGATLLLHGFALLDQDYPFTYIVDPRPWYRWPFSLLEYLGLFLAALGALTFLRGAPGRRKPSRLAAFAFALPIASYAAVHLPVAVECRFGLPLLLLFTPAAAAGAMSLMDRAAMGDRRAVGRVLLGAAFFLAGCALLSAWIARQSSLNG